MALHIALSGQTVGRLRNSACSWYMIGPTYILGRRGCIHNDNTHTTSRFAQKQYASLPKLLIPLSLAWRYLKCSNHGGPHISPGKGSAGHCQPWGPASQWSVMGGRNDSHLVEPLKFGVSLLLELTL